MHTFMIDTAYHKRWMLPDRKHYFNTIIHGDCEHWSVWDMRANECRESGYFRLSDPNWKTLSELAQSLAEKKYRYQPKSDEYLRSYRR